jgi:RHS repeat-associated protein
VVGWVDDFGGASGSAWHANRLVATYEYAPYGEILASSGDFAAANPFRFSTKYHDDETGLIDFGRRLYDPLLGRWINRDPIEELGGVNLYAYVENYPTAAIDGLGLQQAAGTAGLVVTKETAAALAAAAVAIALINQADTVDAAYQLYYLAIDAIVKAEALIGTVTGEMCFRLVKLRAEAEKALQEALKRLAEQIKNEEPLTDPVPPLPPPRVPPAPPEPDDPDCEKMHDEYREACDTPHSCNGISDPGELAKRMKQAAKCLNGRINYRLNCVDRATETPEQRDGHLKAIAAAYSAYETCRGKLEKGPPNCPKGGE